MSRAFFILKEIFRKCVFVGFWMMLCACVWCDVIIAPRGILNSSYQRQLVDGRVRDTFAITKLGRGCVYLSQLSLSSNHDVEFKPDRSGPEKQLMCVKSASVVSMDPGSNMYIGDDSGKHLVTVISSPGFTLAGGVFSTGADLLLTHVNVSEDSVISAQDDARIFMLDRALGDGDIELLGSQSRPGFSYSGQGNVGPRAFVSSELDTLFGRSQTEMRAPGGGRKADMAELGAIEFRSGDSAKGGLTQTGHLSNPQDGMAGMDDLEEEPAAPSILEQGALTERQPAPEPVPQQQPGTSEPAPQQLPGSGNYLEAPRKQAGSQPQPPADKSSQEAVLIEPPDENSRPLMHGSVGSGSSEEKQPSRELIRLLALKRGESVPEDDSQPPELAGRSALDLSQGFLEEVPREPSSESSSEPISVASVNANIAPSQATLATDVVVKDSEDLLPEVVYRGPGFEEIEGAGTAEIEELEALKREMRRAAG